MITEAEEQPPEPRPAGREAVALEAGERCHADAEPAVSLRFAPEDELREEIVHHHSRRVVGRIRGHFVSELLWSGRWTRR